MKLAIPLTFALIAAGSSLALAQGSGGGASGGGAASSTGGTAASPGGVTSGNGMPGATSGAGIPGGTGPNTATPVPNIPSMPESHQTVGSGPGGRTTGNPSGGLYSSPSSLNSGSGTANSNTNPSDPSAATGTPTIMAPERR